MSELYSGIVVENGTSPVRVWLPSKDGWFGVGEQYKGFGVNVLNTITPEKLAQIRQQSQQFYQTCPITSGGEGIYDEGTGKATVQDGCSDFNQILSINDDPNSGTRFSVPGTNEMFDFDQATPGNTNNIVSILQPQGGFQAPTHTNQPKGKFQQLNIGQRVICTFIDNDMTGVILASFPWPSSFNTVLN